MAAKSDERDVIVVAEIQMNYMRFNLVGTTPLMPHSPSAHARGQLLFPSPRKNLAERAVTMKHEPFDEYREAAYCFTNDEVADKKTRFYMPAGAIKRAIADVAIDLKDARKAQIGRLTSVPGMRLPLFGTTKINTMLVRSSDMNRTPDIRTLPILEHWALPKVPIRFVKSLIKEQSIVNLVANAGIIIGIGDGRQQHGYFDFGGWRIANDDDEELQEILKSSTVEKQDAALAQPGYYDLETEKLLTWFVAEKQRRSAAPAVSPRKKKKQQQDDADADALVLSPDALSALVAKQDGKLPSVPDFDV